MMKWTNETLFISCPVSLWEFWNDVWSVKEFWNDGKSETKKEIKNKF